MPKKFYLTEEILAFLKYGTNWPTPMIHDFMMNLEKYWVEEEKKEIALRNLYEKNTKQVPEEA